MNLRQLRKKAGKTQREVADYVGVKPQTYSTWETGKSEFSEMARNQLAEFFQVSPEEIETSHEESNSNDELKKTLNKTTIALKDICDATSDRLDETEIQVLYKCLEAVIDQIESFVSSAGRFVKNADRVSLYQLDSARFSMIRSALKFQKVIYKHLSDYNHNGDYSGRILDGLAETAIGFRPKEIEQEIKELENKINSAQLEKDSSAEGQPEDEV